MSVEEDKLIFSKPSDERTLLSYCFKSTDYLYDLAAKITEKDFLSKEHQMLYMMMNNFIHSKVSH